MYTTCPIDREQIAPSVRLFAWRCGLTLLVIGLTICGGNTPIAIAQSGMTVATDEPTDDIDYALQGEYLGSYCVDTSTGVSRPLGLQICAQGQGSFLVAEYPGGLPGSGWNRVMHETMRVARDGARLRVAGVGYQIEVDGNQAMVARYDGQPLGQLTKVLRESPTLGARPPAGAVVLFDGTSVEHFRNGKITAQGWLDKGTELLQTYENFLLHLEFRLPYMPEARDQGRGNSGVYLLSRYEVQILDSFGLEPRFNHSGSLYRTTAPLINMSLPPLQWQTYDIEFHSPHFDSLGNKLASARISLRHNGVFVHYDTVIENKTGAGSPEGPAPLPTKLQDHGDPVVFRNLWLVDLGK